MANAMKSKTSDEFNTTAQAQGTGVKGAVSQPAVQPATKKSNKIMKKIAVVSFSALTILGAAAFAGGAPNAYAGQSYQYPTQEYVGPNSTVHTRTVIMTPNGPLVQRRSYKQIPQYGYGYGYQQSIPMQVVPGYGYAPGYMPQTQGGVVGGIVGGIVGSRIGQGNGRTAATIVGTLLGSMVGGAQN
jgi:hypothetical protein